MFGSYNKFDAHIVSVVDFLTSLLASIVFSTLGHSAHILGVPVETVAKGGQGLAFVAYPEVSEIREDVDIYHLHLSGLVSASCSVVLVNHFLLNAVPSWIRLAIRCSRDSHLRPL